ncbi:MAG: hypothetical protein LBC67_06480, partial [Spirochaetales bacterium]|nr:hypothetical protein [Spirochaetales bacterium]
MKKILCKIMGLAFFPAALFFTACPPPPVERFEFPASAQRWYYVSSAGSDANSGLTEDAPFKTFAHAAQAAAMDPKSLRVFILDMLDAASEGTLNSSETFLLDGALVRREITISGRKTAGFSGSGTEEIVLRVKNEGRVIIQNIALQDGKTGLFLEGASSARMESGNINSNWRGAFIRSGSSFVMTGGVIENNRIPQSNFGATFGGSGGVCIVDVGSSFTMSGTAHIYGNAAHFSEATAVRALEYTHFVMAGNAVISGNFTPGLSPGDCCVGISPWASFSMSGNALIANNHHVDYGVKLGQSSVFAMEGNAKITATTEGGGVYMDTGADARMAGSSSITNNRNNGVSGYAGNPQDRFFTLGGSARIADNGKAGVSGYGIVLLMTDDAVISGNSQSGIRLVDGSLVINANALVTRNRTEADGGGAALSGTPFTLTGNAVISHNYARLRGGGVSARLSEVKTSPAEQPFTLSGNAVICDNTSGENGGGVYL